VKQIRRRLTYANVMSSIAVFLVLGGAAFAAVQLPKNSVGTKQLKKSAVTSAKVKDGALKAVDFGAGQLPAGPKGDQGPTGKDGKEGKAGKEGPEGPAGTALAYARIEANGTLDASHSEGFASATITHPSEGHYCINGLGIEVNNAMTTPQFLNTASNAFIGDFPGCSGADVSVETVTASTGAFANVPFMILLN